MSFILNPEWIVNPITTYAVTGTGFVGLLSLWFSARLEVARCRKDVTEIRESTEVALRDLAARMEESPARSAPALEPVYETSVPRSQSLNLTRRARALHMRSRGEGTQTIAAALAISQGEVNLLFKLDRLVRNSEE